MIVKIDKSDLKIKAVLTGKIRIGEISDEDTLYVLIREGKQLGVIGVKNHYKEHKAITYVYVVEEYRKQGIASKLIEYVLKEYGDYVIYTHALNTSHKVFLNHGFHTYSVEKYSNLGTVFKMRWNK